MNAISTREKLLQIGKKEFLNKGYKDASLREIAKKAGFTLGAFYGYYGNKEALFDDIVAEAAEELYGYYYEVQMGFSALPEELQIEEMEKISHRGLMTMIDIIYEDFDTYKLIFLRAMGTSYENYTQRFIDLEIESTYSFIEVLTKQGKQVKVDSELIHILVSAMFSGMLEILDHEMSKAKAVNYIDQLRDFYSAGWHQLLKW